MGVSSVYVSNSACPACVFQYLLALPVLHSLLTELTGADAEVEAETDPNTSTSTSISTSTSVRRGGGGAGGARRRYRGAQLLDFLAGFQSGSSLVTDIVQR